MIQETSVATYEEIESQGLLNKLSLKVVEFMATYQDDPIMGGKVSQADASRYLDTNQETCDSIRPRFTELLRRGVIVEAGKKEDPQTGRMVLGYRLSGKLASSTRALKTRSYKQLLQAALVHVPEGHLRDEIINKIKGQS